MGYVSLGQFSLDAGTYILWVLVIGRSRQNIEFFLGKWILCYKAWKVAWLSFFSLTWLRFSCSIGGFGPLSLPKSYF